MPLLEIRNLTKVFGEVRAVDDVSLDIYAGETLGLVGSEFNLSGGFWNMIGAINDRFGIVGYAIIGIFALSWIVSLVVYRANRFDDLQVNSQPG